VAEQRGRIVAAAHLLRYGNGDDVGESYRDVGEIRWFVFWPAAPATSPYWQDSTEAADALMAACLGQLEEWGVTRRYADGDLPAPAVYGVPAQWPHVRAAYERAGFVQEGQTEIVFVASLTELPRPGPAPIAGLMIERSVGINGTRLSASLPGIVVGYIEVDTLVETNKLALQGGLADVGNLHVEESHRRRGIATWLLAQAADWLRPAGVERLLDCARPEQTEYIAFLDHAGFQELTRTQRGWVTVGSPPAPA
jgi:GNAT superfamily N-acetyltransferase